MTPRDIGYWIVGWNDMHAGDGPPAAMSAKRFGELKARYS
ncbi:hypothetical protein SAMN05444339_11039 [Loktanella atrilutea]|uniref:Uncharacterized protein n=1 Tax=Loktanella atrilutea TaxID=366533 RepID=A0A1M5DLF9_LOKAT|nr:hypothetical protein SAMN05444339_11039 [Loktanella atrilutea]